MKEVPNNLRSRQYAKIIDLLSEGPIRGVVNGLMGVYLDGTPLQNELGELSYSNTSVQFVNGYPTQPIMAGFSSQEAEESVGLKLRQYQSITRSIVNTDCDRCRVTVSTPQLSLQDENGDMWGATIAYTIEARPDGGLWHNVGIHYIEGKTMTRYQRSHVFGLPGVGPWEIRVTRSWPDSSTTLLQDDLYWDSFTAIIDDRVNFNRCACVGIQINAEQFGSIPKRTYLVDGLMVLTPTNYDPYAAVYNGPWDGNFKLEWSNNPAWVFYDLLVNNRYGLGSFVLPSMVDKWALYRISQFCDQRVNNGRGGLERRFTCNVQITSQQEAFDLLSQVASIFRGFAYWAGGQVIAKADDPSDPVMQYTNANVLDGSFTYSGADMRARHTMAVTGWQDPNVLGETRFAVVENIEQLSRWGIQKIDDPGFGSTSESQSVRTGKWSLYTEEHESETIAFKTGLETAWVRPGDIIRVADVNIAGERFGGRVGAGSNAQYIRPDAMPPRKINTYYRLSCIVGEGIVESRDAGTGDPVDPNGIFVSPPFSAVPKPDTVFVLNEPGALEPTLWRVMGVRQVEKNIYEISAMRHYPQKWAVVEANVAFADSDISNIARRPQTPFGLAAQDYLVQLSPISVGVRMVVSWQSSAAAFDVYWRLTPGNWMIRRTDAQSIDLEVTEGQYEIRIVPVSRIGVRGDMASINYNVIGRFAPPAAPRQFRVKVSDGVALFEWLPATELDVIIGGHFELRHSSRTTGASWASAQVVIPSIPGTATTVEAVYRVGTWFLRTFDIVGVQSTNVATILALQPDGRFNEFARICENPDFLGTRYFTEVKEPQQWLVLGQTGGLWDEQMADMDDWPDVDVLVEGEPDPPQSVERHGWYLFDNTLDAGGVFTVRLSADILAFPYAEGSTFIDDRLDNSDTWNDWDYVGADLNGQVQLFVRTTNNDPTDPNAIWGAWQVFAPIEYVARGFEFRADLTAPVGQNIAVEELCIVADLRMKMDSGEDVPYPATTRHVTFQVKFFLVPAVVITVQDAVATDTIQVLNKTREGFDINITNGGAQVTRTFDWQARGF